jgi:hypothetical protein
VPGSKLNISWDEINDPKVDHRLKQLDQVAEALEKNRQSPPPPPEPVSRWASFVYNALFYMSMFGFAGGLVGWGLGQMFDLRGSAREDAREMMDNLQQAQAMKEPAFTPEQRQLAIDEANADGATNEYFRIETDPNLTADQRRDELRQMSDRDRIKDVFSDLLFYGLSGMAIAVALGIAEPMVDRNWRAATINGSVAAALGLCGGLAASLFVEWLYEVIAGSAADAGAMADASTGARQIFARATSWGVLGLFLALAPGVVMRNGRKLAAGLVGGVLGGVIGGALYEPMARLAGGGASGHVYARLVAIVAIGLIAGVGTGLIENVVKTGWLKVQSGLIAGKQFILYRNPTYVGSALSAHIYLFKDPQVGKRHAAIHVIKGGYEIEDLPLGGATVVNGAAMVGRQRLRDGDRIQIGRTNFLFQEKAAK